MLSLFCRSGAALAAASLLVISPVAGAAVLYDNGALNGTLGAFTIGGDGGGYAVSNSFVLSSQSVLDSLGFGVWTSPGDTVSTVEWGISTSPNNFSNFIAGGTATVVNGVATLNPTTGYDTSVDTISLGDIHLSAGAYYLVLQNAVASNGDGVYWDETDGPSLAMSNILGTLQNYNRPNTTGSESFQLFSPQSGQTPEPAAWSLMLVGVAALGAALRRRRVAAALQAPSAIRSK